MNFLFTSGYNAPSTVTVYTYNHPLRIAKKAIGKIDLALWSHAIYFATQSALAIVNWQWLMVNRLRLKDPFDN